MVHKTQLYLDESRYQYLINLAKREKKSLAQIVRELIDFHIEERVRGKNKDSFSKVIGIGEGDGKRIAENHETYLYGGKK